MKEKSVWPILPGLVTISLLVTACSPSGATTTPASVVNLPPTVASTSAPNPPGRPQYGGTLNLMSSLDVGIFDPIAAGQVMGQLGFLINEQYLGEDWGKGSAGTNEVEWVPNTSPTPDTSMGILAESWELPEPGTMVFKVRRGVHWGLNPNSEASRLMNGREMTADDWIANFNYLMHHPRSLVKSVPQLASTATMEKTGPWEVTVKAKADPLTQWNWLAWGVVVYFLLPPEVIQKYGDMRDWRNVVGTGPFMLTDFVDGSSATLVKNPNYWGKDPLGPGKGNQLPYLDGVKMLVMPDLSTQLAALRSGKIDSMRGVTAEDASSLIGPLPDLRHRTFLPLFSSIIAMRIDKPDLPYEDRRVRQALMMATDFDALKNDFYGGDAEILAFPVTRESRNAYVPLEEMPPSVQALFRHDPGKARQLLAEAGYTNGFKAKMAVLNGLGSVDLASVYRDMWAEAGVDLELQPKESAVFNSIGYTRAYEDSMLAHLPGATSYPGCLNLPYIEGAASFFYVSDPAIDAACQEIQKHVVVDMPEADRLYRELLPYLAEQAYFIPIPTPVVYVLWWPWLKNWYGESPIRFSAYCWIDQNLKEQVTGRR